MGRAATALARLCRPEGVLMISAFSPDAVITRQDVPRMTHREFTNAAGTYFSAVAHTHPDRKTGAWTAVFRRNDKQAGCNTP